MKTLFLFITLLTIATAAPAESLLIVQSNRSTVADAAVAGFRSACNLESRTLVLSDYATVDLTRIVREEQPDLVLTVGENAYNAARKVRNVPVIATLSLSLSADRKSPANITGVDLRVPSANYLKLFAALGVKRVGVVYRPDQNGAYLQGAKRAAEKQGITLVLRPTDSPKDAIRKLHGLKGLVDALWLVPDSATLAAPAQEALFLQSMEQKDPVVGFLKDNLKQGAAVVLAADWQKMGRQAGEEANRLLDGATPREVPPGHTQNFVLVKNNNVLNVLGFNSPVLDRLFP
jgi:putative tryptophan/tyrosine transport system substrate-binding protein